MQMNHKPTALPRLAPSGTSHSIRSSRECLTLPAEPPVASSTSQAWIIGDQCFLDGMKPAKIAFLGETKFGQGEWAGLVFDEPVGKNDGSVNGVRYFQCAQNCGLFCRINKLTRAQSVEIDDLNVTVREKSAPPVEHSTPKNEAGAGSTSSSPVSDAFKMGDRVAVIGSLDKVGGLKFLGATKFAEGRWAGIDLDHPVGKNDGSVQNIRYFACKPKHGIFVPLSKLVPESRRYSMGSTSNLSVVSCSSTGRPSLPVRHNISSVLRMQRGAGSKAGSQESLCSIGSLQNSTTKRVKLGVAALNSPGFTPRRDPLPSISDSSHEECHKNMSAFKLQMDQLYLSLEQSVSECKKFENMYDEEKKKSEDLVFRHEEESIVKLQLETKIAEMETLLTNVKATGKSALTDNQLALSSALELNLKSLQSENANLSQNHLITMSALEAQKTRNLELEDKINGLQNFIKKSECDLKDAQNLTEKLGLDIVEISGHSEEFQQEKERISKLSEDYSLENASLKNQIDVLSKKIEEKQFQITRSEKHSSELKLDLDNLQNIVKKLENDVKDVKYEKEKLENETNRQSNEFKQEKEIISKSNEKYESENVALKGQVDVMSREIMEKQSQIAESMDDNTMLKAELEKLRIDVKKLDSDLKGAQNEREKLERDFSETNGNSIEFKREKDIVLKLNEKYQLENTDLKGHIDILSKEIERLKNEISESEKHCSTLNSDLEKLSGAESKCIDLTKNCDRLSTENVELQTACCNLQSKLDKLEINLSQLSHELDLANQKYNASIQSSNDHQAEETKWLHKLNQNAKELEDQQDLLLKLQTENLKLHKKIGLIEKDNQILISKLNGVNKAELVDDAPSINFDENERKIDFNRQITFLNSVIGDLTSKNQELNLKVDLFYSQGASESLRFDKYFPKKQPKPRLFCDICDTFDAHDTEECPKQSSDVIAASENEVDHSKHGGKRGQSRPYCQNCEVFGHDTEGCDKTMETF